MREQEGCQMHKVLGSQLCFQNIYLFIYKGYTFGEKVLLLKVTS